jgi:hypothetical protein
VSIPAADVTALPAGVYTLLLSLPSNTSATVQLRLRNGTQLGPFTATSPSLQAGHSRWQQP